MRTKDRINAIKEIRNTAISFKNIDISKDSNPIYLFSDWINLKIIVKNKLYVKSEYGKKLLILPIYNERLEETMMILRLLFIKIQSLSLRVISLSKWYGEL